MIIFNQLLIILGFFFSFFCTAVIDNIKQKDVTTKSSFSMNSSSWTNQCSVVLLAQINFTTDLPTVTKLTAENLYSTSSFSYIKNLLYFLYIYYQYNQLCIYTNRSSTCFISKQYGIRKSIYYIEIKCEHFLVLNSCGCIIMKHQPLRLYSILFY